MYDNYDATATALAAGFSVAYAVIAIIIAVASLVAMWKIFEKAGKPGWAAIIPIYNVYCLFEITFGLGWLFFVCFIPCVNFIVMIVLCFKLSKAFGQGIGFGFGLLFLNTIFILMLGFGKYEYVGPNGIQMDGGNN